MKATRVVLLTVGVLAILLGLTLGAAGLGLAVAATQRDGDGYLTTPSARVVTDAAAVTTPTAELTAHPGDWVGWVDRVDVRVTVRPTAPDGAVFVGIAPTDEVRTYLAGAAHDELARMRPVRLTRLGAADVEAIPAPADQTFWTVSRAGTGEQTLDWTLQPGRWSVVVANADGTPGVDVAVSGGVLTGSLSGPVVALLVAALLFVVAGTAAVLGGVGGRPTPVTTVAPGSAVHPVQLRGELDPQVGRATWLVKWLLLVPHILVLLVLWPAAVVVTVAAALAILVTGRYPAPLFEFTVGVARWSWRVGFYGYSALGTDRYPPFTLADDPSYPAGLDVAYPARLSRGLVLVKWLLALPHLLIVGLLTGSAISWTIETVADRGWQLSLVGLIGVLTLVAGVSLLVRGRYPQALFDLVVGLDRWVVRVAAYVGLLTDVYPPFRLDQGGQEPRPVPPSPPPPPPATTPPPLGVGGGQA